MMKKLILLCLLACQIVTRAQVRLTWVDNNPQTVVDGWFVFQSKDSNTNLVLITTTTNAWADISGLTNNVVYKWQVAAFNAYDTSALSTGITYTLPLVPLMAYPTNPPSNLVTYPINLLSNGDFENNIDPFKWTLAGKAVLITNSLAQQGKTCVQFTGGPRAGDSTATKMIDNLMRKSTKYRLAFNLGAYGTNNLAYTKKILVTIDGKKRLAYYQATVSPLTSAPYYNYSDKFVSFVPDSETILIRFTDLSATNDNTDMLLDDVKVIFADN